MIDVWSASLSFRFYTIKIYATETSLGAFCYGVLSVFHLAHRQDIFKLKSKEKQPHFISAKKLKADEQH